MAVSRLVLLSQCGRLPSPSARITVPAGHLQSSDCRLEVIKPYNIPARHRREYILTEPLRQSGNSVVTNKQFGSLA
jgi:hypothetical protein